MSKRLSLLCAAGVLALGTPLAAGAAVHRQPLKHGAGSASANSAGKGGKQQKNCHNLPCW